MLKSILDNDLYKFTMMMAVCQLFPDVHVKYSFINRGKTKFRDGFDAKVAKAVRSMDSLRLTSNEKKWLQENCPYFTSVFIDLLSGYQYDHREVQVTMNDGELEIEVEGPWYRTILWEVPLMAIISELHFKDEQVDLGGFSEQDKEKFIRLNRHSFVEMGTRRRYSFNNQLRVLEGAITYAPDGFLGTSNVYFAYLLGLKPFGTKAHEWYSFHGATYGYKMANLMAMENWINVYDGDLGIALTDTFGTNNFFDSMTMKLTKLFDGLRHDSGCPFRFIDRSKEHYLSKGINPMTKPLVFSDGLNADTVDAIADECVKEQVAHSFGIGTYLSNDVGVKALNMVIKMVACTVNGEWNSVIKLSDVAGKHTGNPAEIALAKQTVGY